MPVQMTRLGPKEAKGTCPTCMHPFAVYFYENRNVERFFCRWCGQWVTAELTNAGLDVSTKDADHTPIRRDENCPNPDCHAGWELWFHPNGAIEKPHGVVIVGSSNSVRCIKCGTYATASLN